MGPAAVLRAANSVNHPNVFSEAKKMDKKVIALGLAALITAGTASAELKAFKVNGETVTVAEQKVLYDRAIAQGQPAGDELERQVKNILVQQKVLLQEAKKA